MITAQEARNLSKRDPESVVDWYMEKIENCIKYACINGLDSTSVQVCSFSYGVNIPSLVCDHLIDLGYFVEVTYDPCKFLPAASISISWKV